MKLNSLESVMADFRKMKFKIFTVFVLLFVLTISACKKDSGKEDPLKAEDFLDVSYGSHEQNTFDVYLPEKRGDTTRVIIMLHGGTWFEGDKKELTEYALYYRNKGFVVVNMNYRLTGTAETIHPAQQNDITAAITYIVSKSHAWHIPANKFGLLGVSAGGHLALLYTYAYDVKNKIQTVVALSAPTNFTDIENLSLQQAVAIEALVGKTYDQDPSLYFKISPLVQVNSLSKATLLLHAKNDEIVLVQQAMALKNKLIQFGVAQSSFLEYETGHTLVNDTNKKEILDNIEAWLRGNIL
ncbi:MAG: alpha/beta hydrolase [Sphingobacteriaceae bacterium]|nr:alpha/beta hydrolase [Sphingobacteriaceae bacterium]